MQDKKRKPWYDDPVWIYNNTGMLFVIATIGAIFLGLLLTYALMISGLVS